MSMGVTTTGNYYVQYRVRVLKAQGKNILEKAKPVRTRLKSAKKKSKPVKLLLWKALPVGRFTLMNWRNCTSTTSKFLREKNIG
mgnify:CR=1 FL=1